MDRLAGSATVRDSVPRAPTSGAPVGSPWAESELAQLIALVLAMTALLSFLEVGLRRTHPRR
jgi:hypothetical protein